MPHELDVTAEDHVQGAADARITLIGYGDYECPHCGHAYWAIKELQERFGDELRFVYRNFPLTEIHLLAERAAETAEFAGAHNRFWEMHGAIYEHQEQLSLEMLLQLAEGLSLSKAELQEALGQGRFLPRIQRDFAGGVRAGVKGTPTFFVNGVRFDGSVEGLGAVLEQDRGRRAA